MGRLIKSRIFAPLLSARGVLAFAVFLPDVTGFFAAPFADFWSLGTPFFEVARLFVGGQLAAGAMVSTASVKKRAGRTKFMITDQYRGIFKRTCAPSPPA